MPKEKSSGKRSSSPFHLEFKNQAQKMAWGAFDQHDVLFLLGPAGTGKALTMNSKLYTRSGYILMKDAKIGDEIANPDGNFSKITGVFPQGKKQICRVHFSDETYVDCCEEHLWSVSHEDNDSEYCVFDTKYIENNCRRNDGKRILSVKCTKPVNFDRKKFVISPYLMGFLISEGCFAGYFKAKIYKKSVDRRIVFKNKYIEELKNLNLCNKLSYEKNIPEMYFYGSVDQRISLLQGLMDGNRTVGKTCSISYSTNSYQLAKDFCQLIYSLGGTARIKIKECSLKDGGVSCRISYRCYFNLPNDVEIFLLSRKNKIIKSRSIHSPKKYIDRVERLGLEEMQCISVDHKDSLYLTDNYIVTHNTHLACAFAIGEILAKRKKRIILTRPIVEAGESLGFLPGTFDEKVNPYMLPMYDCINKCVGLEGPQRDIINRSIEVAPIAYMRGRAIYDNELIPTPSGMKPMGNIKVGDYVLGSNGTPTKVLNVYPQGVKPLVEVIFSDKSKSVCSLDHLWNTMTLNEKNKGYTTKSTEFIMNSLKDKYGRKNHKVPIMSGQAFFDYKEVPIHPYVLGVLLGSESITKNLSITTSDIEIIDECMKNIGENFKIIYKGKYKYKIQSCRKKNNLKENLLKMGLWEKNNSEKFIPDEYKFNFKEIRFQILQGLMDINGKIYRHRSGNDRIQFSSTSKKIAEDVAWLVRSIGGFAILSKRKHNYIVDISIHFNLFNLKRKTDEFKASGKLSKTISSINFVEPGNCTCIKVDAHDNLFLTNDFIVTHNTFDDAVCIFDEAQNATKSQLKLFMTRFGENSKIIITGDPMQSDIGGGHTALVNIVKKLEEVNGIGVIHFKASSIVRHPLIASIIEKFEEE